MLRQLTCRELGIEIRPMAEDEYKQDSVITNPMDMPTTIGRVKEFADYVKEQFVDIGQDGTINDKVVFMNLGSDGKPMYIGHGLKRNK